MANVNSIVRLQSTKGSAFVTGWNLQSVNEETKDLHKTLICVRGRPFMTYAPRRGGGLVEKQTK